MRQVEDVMGMPVTIQVADAVATTAAVDEAFEEFRRLDEVFSPFKPTSAVSRINRGELAPLDAGALVQQAIHLCEMYGAATDGFFSAWIGGEFNPSGLVKGWAIDRACSILEQRGCSNFFVDAGGDVQTRGTNEGAPWRVGIRHPVLRDKVVRVVLASDLAVATSGTYEKGRHITDPHTGRAAEAFVSLTVVGPDIVEADVIATAAFAKGEGAFELIGRFPGLEAFAIRTDNTATWTAGFDAYCESRSELAGDAGRG